MKILTRLRKGSPHDEAGVHGSRRTASEPKSSAAPKSSGRHRSLDLDRVDEARDDRNERARLRDEARYRRERLDLYRARLYGGRASSQGKLRELQRASDGAAARLSRAESAVATTAARRPKTGGEGANETA